MGAYFPDKNNDNILELSRDLSPITNFSLDFFANIISEKNLIVNFPDFKLGPISLFSYIFAEKFEDCTSCPPVTIFTSCEIETFEPICMLPLASNRHPLFIVE